MPREKLYYRMGEVSEMIGTEAHNLRYWEQEFPQIKPRKNKSGHRVFNREDIEVIRKIKKMLHDEGLSIADARVRLNEADKAVVQTELTFSSETPTNTASATPSGTPKKKILSEIREVKSILKNLIKTLDDGDPS